MSPAAAASLVPISHDIPNLTTAHPPIPGHLDTGHAGSPLPFNTGVMGALSSHICIMGALSSHTGIMGALSSHIGIMGHFAPILGVCEAGGP